MTLFAFTLSSLLSRNGDPAIWACPIQQGIPALLNLATDILLWVALFAFIGGILLAVFNYLTAFGDENKAKKGKETLKWTFIGAIVVMLSAIIISTVAGLLVSDSQKSQTQVLQTNILTGKPEIVLQNSTSDTLNGSCGGKATAEQNSLAQEMLRVRRLFLGF